MPYDTELEKKLDREAHELGIDDKKKMFGGIGYMLKGNMVFGIHKQWLIIRTSPDDSCEWLKKEGVKTFDITGRPMQGWLMIDPESIKTDKQLSDFLKLSLRYVKTLPEK
jgi:hypothetical protein